MSEQAEETPLAELLRNVPADDRVEWVIQRAENGTTIGYSSRPIVGVLAHKAANKIDELQAEIERLSNPWVSVEDRLPEFYVDVLALWRNRAWVIACAREDGSWPGYDHEITHWMPIPEIKE